jgi:hypothetical protein
MPILYAVHTSKGLWEVFATSAANAVSSALELAGPGTRVLRIARQGEW